MKNNRIGAIFLFSPILFFLFFSTFSACKNSNDSEKNNKQYIEEADEFEVINMDGKFSWTYGMSDELETEKDFLALKDSDDFVPFDNRGRKNLAKLVGRDGNYIWLRAEFEIPPSLKGHSLGLVIPFLHFSEKLYLNDKFVWSYGSFPPNYQNAMYESHYYYFPQEYLNQEGKNTILIKVYCLGNASMSKGVFITEYDKAEQKSEAYSFRASKIYLLFESGLFASALVFLLIFIQQPVKKDNYEYHDFAVMNFFTMLFITPFFASELPWYMSYNIPYLIFQKLFFCIPPVFIMYFIASFITHFIKFKQPTWVIILRTIFLVVPLVVIVAAPTYKFLIAIAPYIVAVLVLHFLTGFVFMTILFLKKSDKQKEYRTRCHIITFSFMPFVISVVIDFILRIVFQNQLLPFFAVIGWQMTIISFLIVLTVEFVKLSNENKNHKEELAQQIELVKRERDEKNERLEKELSRSNQDLQMASVVQKKYFPSPEAMLRGWQVSVCYEPSSEVSGDLYDYYYDDENNLNGVALFDVSGHALASALVTMLAKNIIGRNFERAMRSEEKVSDTLSKINDIICEEKGDVDNYMTGLLLRTLQVSSKNESLISIASAGHPFPLLYHAATGVIERVGVTKQDEQYGTIGMKDMPVLFSQINFTMEVDDILVMYTDGLTESKNEAYEQFGLERVSKILLTHHEESANQIQTAIFNGLKEFVGDMSIDDDITIVVLKREDVDDFIEELEEV